VEGLRKANNGPREQEAMGARIRQCGSNDQDAGFAPELVGRGIPHWIGGLPGIILGSRSRLASSPAQLSRRSRCVYLLFFVPMVLKYLEGAPIRRLFDRLKEQAKPADEPSRLTINDFFTQLVGDPDRADSAKLEGNKRDLEGTTCNPLVAAAPLVTCIAQNNDRDQVKDANGIEGVETHRDTNVQASPKLPNEQPHADADHTTELPIMRRPTMASHTYTDPLMATLAASIVAHERSVASFRDLLQEHQRPRRILRHISG
jgi:hypothetical protein